MKRIAIIPARGGSKRIPNKNSKLFHGKPILAYSIEAALNSELFDEVMVSTDDPQIAKIALEFGAKVPFLRSEKNFRSRNKKRDNKSNLPQVSTIKYTNSTTCRRN